MRRTLTISSLAAALLFVACGNDGGPIGVELTRYWDIVWSSPDAVLTDIEMAGDTLGWACGFRYNAAQDTHDALIYQYDGTTWKVSYFMPGMADAQLLALDFVTPTNGWAVGNGDGPLVLHYDGSAWLNVTTAGLDGGNVKLLAALGDADVWVSDGEDSFHFDGTVWTRFPITTFGAVDKWVFPDPSVGWAVDYQSGYCYRWDAANMMWVLENYPLYNVTSFYFLPDGSGMYADYVEIPPVTERADVFQRVAGDPPTYERIFATNERKFLATCDYFPPDYFFFAGPNAAYEVNQGHVKALNYVPAAELGYLFGISVAAPGNVWGIMGPNSSRGPSFIVHKKGG